MNTSVAAHATKAGALSRLPAEERSATPPRRLRLAPTPRRRRFRVAVALTAILVVGSLFALVGINVLLVQGQYELDALRSQVEAEQRRYETLRLEVAELVAPERIIAAAGELGLAAAETVDWVEAPVPATPSSGPDMTTETLTETWREGKYHLARGR